ncbi:MAG TPA: universal stress protein [Gaiellales bacterium]
MIVVGIDGSDGARKALEFAADEAARRDSDLRIVCAWHVPGQVYAGPVMPPIDADTFEAAMRKIAEDQASAVLRDRPQLRHELVMRDGNAAGALVEESERAEMLVVGSRGHGGFASLLLGSVSQQCAAHSLCPVVIVPAHSRPRPAG